MSSTGKRHLPVLQTPAAPPSGTPGDDGAEPPPPWHWVPIGTFVSLVVGTVFARSFYTPYMQSQLARAVGTGAGSAVQSRFEALAPGVRDALLLRLSLVAMAVAMLSVFVGGVVVGRFGPRTTPRHGTLAGLLTMVLLLLLVGRSAGAASFLGSLLAIPLGGLCGWLGAFTGGVSKRIG